MGRGPWEVGLRRCTNRSDKSTCCVVMGYSNQKSKRGKQNFAEWSGKRVMKQNTSDFGWNGTVGRWSKALH